MYYPKIQLVDSELIDNGTLYLQFGRITDKDCTYKNGSDRVRENGVKWYTPYPNPFETTSGIVGGGEINDTLITTRTNLIPITAQFQTLAQAIPYWEFYKTTTCDVFDGIVSNVPITSEDISNEIKSLDDIITDLTKTKDKLSADLEIVLKLEEQIKIK